MIVRLDCIVFDERHKAKLLSKAADLDCPIIAVSTLERELTISIEEANELLDYFVKRAGYISHEFDMPTHRFIKRLTEFSNEEAKERKKESTENQGWTQ